MTSGEGVLVNAPIRGVRPRFVVVALVVAIAVSAPGALQTGDRRVTPDELQGIVAPGLSPAFDAAGVPLVGRGIDGTAAPAAAVQAQAAAAVREPPPPPPPPDHQPLRPAVARMDFPDPTVLNTGGRYYAFATNAGGRNVQVSSSADLATWSDPSDALPTLPAWSRPGQTWAPAVAAIGGWYVLYVSLPWAIDGTQCVDRFVSAEPGGPYQAVADMPLVCNTVGGGGIIDPSLFVSDGRVFLYWKSAGSSAQQIFVSELTPDGLQVAAEPRHLLTSSESWEAGGVENPAMVQAGGRFWLFYSANWWTDDRYTMGWARCDSPLGPCTKAAGPWLASRDGVAGPGGGSFFTDGSGHPYIAFHSWGGGIGYTRSGYRQLHVEPVDLNGGWPSFADREPVGSLDAVVRAPGGVFVAGTASDPDTVRAIDVEVRVNGWPRDHVTADGHRYASLLPLAPGRHTVCVTAVDDLRMSTPQLGCADIDVTDAPTGALEAADAVSVSGWALDPDTDAPVVVDVYVDRVLAQSVVADGARPDVAAAHPGYGSGWAVALTLAPGDHEVCAYAADDTDQPSINIGCALVHAA